MMSCYTFCDPWLAEYLNRRLVHLPADSDHHDDQLIARGDPGKDESRCCERWLGCSLVIHIHPLSILDNRRTHNPLVIYRRDGLTPWDAGQSQPPLRGILASGKVNFPTQGTALVPGCGRVGGWFA
jgi:hypothetical protein